MLKSFLSLFLVSTFFLAGECQEIVTDPETKLSYLKGQWIFLFDKDLAEEWKANYTDSPEYAELKDKKKLGEFSFSLNKGKIGLAGFVLDVDDAIIDKIKDADLKGLKKIFRFIYRNDILKLEQDSTSCVQQISGQYNLPSLSALTENRNDYIYPAQGGEGVDVYVLDTGVTTSHPDFGERASFGKDFTSPLSSQIRNDDNGHGTHVAGIIASDTYGVAKMANIIGVKVLGADGSGSTFDIIMAMIWVLEQRQANGRPAVVNLSLGGGFSSGLNAVTDDLVEFGVPVIAAAGNEGADACGSSPASAASAITVAAFDSNAGMAGFSNFGQCVDIFGPGVNIVSLSNTGQGTRVLSGTSQAAPHIAGIIAIYQSQTISETGSEASPAALAQALLDNAVSGRVQNIQRGSGTPNEAAQVSCSGNVVLTVDTSGDGAASSISFNAMTMVLVLILQLLLC